MIPSHIPRVFDPPCNWRLPNLLSAMQQKQIRWLHSATPCRKWSPEQQLSLLDSVLQGYPIGVVLLWRNGEHEYLLDGQCRMNVLLSAFPCVERIDVGVRSNVYVDLQAGEFRVKEFGASHPPHWVPTAYLLTAQGFHDQQRRLWKLKLDEEADALERFRDCFLEYRVPVVHVTTGSEEKAMEVRERVNSTILGVRGA